MKKGVKKNHFIVIGILIAVVILGVAGGAYVAYRNSFSPKQNLWLPYLKKVYPLISTDKSPAEYQKLYNSLGFYYQCCGTNYTYCYWWRPTGQWYPAKWNPSTKTTVYGRENVKVLSPQGAAALTCRYPPTSWMTPPTNAYNPPSPFGTGINKGEPTWGPLECCNNVYRLPTVPTGYLYDWQSFQYFNVPVVYVDENATLTGPAGYRFSENDTVGDPQGRLKSIESWQSYCPGRTFVGTFAGGDITPTNPVCGTTPLGLFAGPAPFYAANHAIVRAMYYPFGPQFRYKTKQWGLFDPKQGKVSFDPSTFPTCEISQTMAKKCSVDKTVGEPWVNGFKEGENREIGHVQLIPGMPASTGYWFNYFGGGGTGIFHKYGRSPRISKQQVDDLRSANKDLDYNGFEGTCPRNKMHCLFTLLHELSILENIKDRYPQFDPTELRVNNNYQGTILGGIYKDDMITRIKSGSDFLKWQFGTDDPFVITMWYANGFVGRGIDEKPNPEFWQCVDYQGNPLNDSMITLQKINNGFF